MLVSSASVETLAVPHATSRTCLLAAGSTGRPVRQRPVSEEGDRRALPELSVVIATHNRSELIAGLLESLDRQTAAPASYEVVVVVDGSTDDTLEVLGRLSTRFSLVVVPQQQQGGYYPPQQQGGYALQQLAPAYPGYAPQQQPEPAQAYSPGAPPTDNGDAK